MKAIRTRYIGRSNTHGPRIIASDGDRNSLSIPYPHALTPDDAHELAAYKLMQKMGLSNELNGGGFQNDNYWTMLPRTNRALPPAYEVFLNSHAHQIAA